MKLPQFLGIIYELQNYLTKKTKARRKKPNELSSDINTQLCSYILYFHRNHPEKKIDIGDKNYKKYI